MMVRTVCAILAIFEMALPAAAQDTTGTESRKVRVIHALPKASNLSVSIGGQQVFENLKHKDVTEYKSIPGNGGAVTLNAADGAVPLRKPASLPKGSGNLTVLVAADPDATGTLAAMVTTFRIGGASANGPGQVTLVNAAPDVKATDLFVDGKKIHAGVNFAGHNGPDSVTTGTHSIKVMDGRGQNVISEETLNVETGRSYTAVVFSAGEAKLGEDIGAIQAPPQADAISSYPYMPP
jgi:hypothetical protein